MLVIVFDHDGTIKLVGGLLAAEMGLNKSALLGQSAQKIRRSLPISVNHLKRALNHQTFNALVEFENKKYEVCYQPVLHQGKVTHVVCTAQDITLRLEAEKLLVEQQAKLANSSRLIALGEMAGGMAHEINNPITIILGNCNFLSQILQKTPFDLPKASERLSKIQSTAERIAKIIRGLLNIARGGEEDDFAETNLPELVKGCIEICRERFSLSGVTLSYEHQTDLSITLCQSSRISQVILNLLSNAFDAVQNLSNKWIQIESRISESETLITVTDSGNGIPPGVKQKMFEPFYTTKDVNKGTGIGLSLVRSIIEHHRGSIDVDDQVANTRFVIRWSHGPSGLGQKAS